MPYLKGIISRDTILTIKTPPCEGARELESMKEIVKKMITEAMAAQHADVNQIKKKRGQKFVIDDTKTYVDAVKSMKAAGAQSKAVFALHKDSVNAHYMILKGLTKTIRPEDDPFVEHYQTPVVMEILCDEDPAFEKSVDSFIAAVGKAEALIGKESARRYAGFYGPTCVVDFALIPGSSSNIVNQILKKTKIPVTHKQAILAAKSWGMNTSYGIGDVFAHAVEGGATLADAVKKEVAIIQSIYKTPVAAQAKLMDDAGQSSFDCRKYMKAYRAKMEGTVKAAIDDDVHYGNIVTVPAVLCRRYRPPHRPVHVQHVQGRRDHGGDRVRDRSDGQDPPCRSAENQE